jgi:hypothetical protein
VPRARLGEARVVAPETTTIRMELRRDGELPSGQASDGHGRVMAFTGWIGLVAAVDELLPAEGREEPSGGD